MPASTIPHGDGWPTLWKAHNDPTPPTVLLLREILRDLPRLGEDRACLGASPETFDAASEDDAQHAISLGRACPALTACREWSTTQRRLEGVVAGRLHGESRRFRSQLAYADRVGSRQNA
jgi:hypothetical protein